MITDSFAAIVHCSPDAILVVDESGVVRFANPSAENLLCRGCSDLVGKDFGFPVVAGETTELDIVCPQGGLAVAEMRVAEVDWDAERMRVAMLREISQRKTMEKALAESEQRYRELVNMAPDGVLLFRQGRAVFANRRAAELFGTADLLFLGAERILHPDSLPLWREVADRLDRWPQEGDAEVHRLSLLARTEGGRDMDVEVAMVACRWQGLVAIHSLWRDVTRQRQMEQRLRRLNSRLAHRVADEVSKSREKDYLLVQQSRLAAMGEMIHNIAHQWRQPLNALGLLLANIEDAFAFGDLSPEWLHDEVVRGQALMRQMSDTIDDFRDFFRPTRTPETYSVRRVLHETMTLVGATVSRHGIEFEILPGEDISTFGFPRELAQVVLNLATNAQDAILERQIPNGHIAISVEKEWDAFVVHVDDNGGGVAPDIRGHLFDPYFTTKSKGSGIGLYMSKMLVEHMKGSIGLTDLPEGSRFSVRLPLVCCS